MPPVSTGDAVLYHFERLTREGSIVIQSRPAMVMYHVTPSWSGDPLTRLLVSFDEDDVGPWGDSYRAQPIRLAQHLDPVTPPRSKAGTWSEVDLPKLGGG